MIKKKMKIINIEEKKINISIYKLFNQLLYIS